MYWIWLYLITYPKAKLSNWDMGKYGPSSIVASAPYILLNQFVASTIYSIISKRPLLLIIMCSIFNQMRWSSSIIIIRTQQNIK